jgi:hydrogenase maturation protease
MKIFQIGQNEPNSKPIQSQNKANSNPIQSQYKPKQTQLTRQWRIWIILSSSRPTHSFDPCPAMFSTYAQARQGQAGIIANPAGHLNKGLEVQINMNVERNRRPILILGIGNILLRDEGVGVRVIERMQNMHLPDDVELLDGGTAGADLMDVLAERKKVIVIDAVQADCQPGTVLRFTADDLTQPDRVGMSLHEFGLAEALKMTKQLGCAPEEVVVFGIKPRDISCGLELSKEIAASIPKVVELVSAEIAK